MRKKIATSALALSLAFAAVPAVSPATVTAATAPVDFTAADANETSEAINRGIENAFDPDKASSMEEESFSGFMKMMFKPYKLMFSGDLEQSSQGVTQAIINYLIIAAGVTIIGQAIQIVMANMPR